MKAPATLPHGGLRRPASAFLVLAREEARFEPDVEVVPGQTRGHGDRAEEADRVDDPIALERLLPVLELQLLFPGVEARAVEVGALDHVAEAAIAARQHALQHAGGRCRARAA